MSLSKNVFEDIRAAEMAALEGNINELQAFIYLKEIEEAAKEAKDNITKIALDQFENYGEKEVVEAGYKISRVQSGRYNYSKIKVWEEKKTELTNIETKAKHAYYMLSKGITPIDEATGEIIEAAEYKPSTSTLKVVKIKE